MPIWHPTNEAEVDTLLEAQVKVCITALFELFKFSCGSSMTQSFALLCRCMDTDGETFKPVYLFNAKLVHLVDDIFWLMSFRSAEHAEKVLR